MKRPFCQIRYPTPSPLSRAEGFSYAPFLLYTTAISAKPILLKPAR
jgi:hypothetical protein